MILIDLVTNKKAGWPYLRHLVMHRHLVFFKTSMCYMGPQLRPM